MNSIRYRKRSSSPRSQARSSARISSSRSKAARMCRPTSSSTSSGGTAPPTTRRRDPDRHRRRQGNAADQLLPARRGEQGAVPGRAQRTAPIHRSGEVRFLPARTKYWASMDHFGFTRIHIAEDFHRRYERLLEGGIWAIVNIEFRPTEEPEQGQARSTSSEISRSSSRGSTSTSFGHARRNSRPTSGSSC